MRESENEVYLNTEEVKSEYGWAKGTLYYFRELGLIESYKFVGDKTAYWKKTDLESIKNRPPQATKRGPKIAALTKLNHQGDETTRRLVLTH